MKHLSFVLFLALIINSGSSFAQLSSESNSLVWYTDLVLANEVSKATNKPIFAFFTGSDWCGWCRKLQNEVFAKPAFVAWAKEKVILLELDFPHQKQLPPDLAQQNNSLQNAFKVQGFPTVWFFFMARNDTTNNFIISPLGSTGYPSGAEPGKEEVKFIQNAEIILANKSPNTK